MAKLHAGGQGDLETGAPFARGAPLEEQQAALEVEQKLRRVSNPADRAHAGGADGRGGLQRPQVEHGVTHPTTRETPRITQVPRGGPLTNVCWFKSSIAQNRGAQAS